MERCERELERSRQKWRWLDSQKTSCGRGATWAGHDASDALPYVALSFHAVQELWAERAMPPKSVRHMVDGLKPVVFDGLGGRGS